MVQAFRVGGYLMGVAVAALGPVVVLGRGGGLRDLTAASPGAVGVSTFLVLLGVYGIVRSGRLRHAVASPDGIRAGGRLVSWPRVERLAVSNGRVTIRHEGGTIQSLLLMPRPPGDYSAPPEDYFERVIAWWRGVADVEEVWRPLGHLYKARSCVTSTPAV